MKAADREEVNCSAADCNSLQDHLFFYNYIFMSRQLAESCPVLPFIAELKKLGKLCEEEVKKLELAMNEALANAVDHGNLELDSTLREQCDREGVDQYSKLRRERLKDQRLGSRMVFVKVCADKSGLRVSVKDQGFGFRHPSSPTSFLETGMAMPTCSGRGLILIRSASDELKFNESGNELMFYKRFSVNAV